MGLFVVLLMPVVVAASDDHPLQRWALLATEEVADTGLPDLLAVELSRIESIQLVERQRLSDAMRELQLASLFKAEHVASRLQLGRTLRADAIMLLSFERQADQRVCRIVICGARLGVRLWDGSFVLTDESDVAELVQRCVTTIEEVRLQFADGIRHIIAVPPFLSEDFEHQFDYLQNRYSEALTNGLIATAGVAVVELEEARAVLRELEDTLSGGLDRPVASIVKATYRVFPADENRQRLVRFNIDIAHGDHQREQIDKTLTLDAAGQWLIQEFAPHVLQLAEKHSPSLSPKAQKVILSRHAQRFAQLGDWGRSTSLREAALVLDPNDVMQRVKLISEYQYSFTSDIDAYWHAKWGAKVHPPAERERAFRRAADDYCTGLEHLAFLIRNRLVNRVDAVGMFGKHIWYKPHVVGASAGDVIKFQALQPACEAQREFVREVYPLTSELPPGRLLSQHFSTPYYGGQYVVTTHVAMDVAFNHYSPESSASLKDLLVRVLPGDAKPSWSILGVLGHAYAPNTEEWRTLLTELSTSEREIARLYGQYALALAAKRQHGSPQRLERLLVELQRLGRTDEPLYDVINLQLMRPKSQPVRPPTAPLRQGKFGPLGRLQLQPISLVVHGQQKLDPPLRIEGMLRCGERDAYWTKDQFFIMDEPNVLRELKLTAATSPDSLFWEVHWDGECIWLHVRGQGIVVIRPEGDRLQQFPLNRGREDRGSESVSRISQARTVHDLSGCAVATFKQQLPKYGRGHKLLGLSPRRAMMVGTFGDSNRAWCGLLEVDEAGHPSANIFFEAKRVAEGRTAEQASADPHSVFQAHGLSHVRHTNGKEYVLVDRQGLSPLQIDLASLEVSVADRINGTPGLSTLTKHGFSGRLFLREGQRFSVRSGVAISVNSRLILFHDGWLYRPGYVWMRDHTVTRKLERLQSHTLPHAYWHLRVGSSAHYGLVTFDPNDPGPPLSQVTILEEQPATVR